MNFCNETKQFFEVCFSFDTAGGRLARPGAFGVRAHRGRLCVEKKNRVDIGDLIFFLSFSMHPDASRSRQQLSSAYLVAKIDLDTAENGPCKV